VKQNVGFVDRSVRVAVGLVLVAVLLTAESPLRWFGLIGLVPLATAAAGWCPLYTLLGISTCPAGQARS
jgi:hypothetical protein